MPKPLSAFTLDVLADPDAQGLDHPVHLEFADTLRASFATIGIRSTIEELNRLGHRLEPEECHSPGWLIFREPLPNRDDELQISCTEDEAELLITTPMSDAAWQRKLAERKAGLGPEERSRQEAREEFYERGGDLYANRYDEWSDLDEVDRALMALFVLETEVNNGGFSQYYSNTGGHQAEALAGILEAIGAPSAATLVRESMRLVGGSSGIELTEAQWAALDAREEDLIALDDRFYALDEDLAFLAMAWAAGAGSE